MYVLIPFASLITIVYALYRSHWIQFVIRYWVFTIQHVQLFEQDLPDFMVAFT